MKLGKGESLMSQVLDFVEFMKKSEQYFNGINIHSITHIKTDSKNYQYTIVMEIPPGDFDLRFSHSKDKGFSHHPPNTMMHQIWLPWKYLVFRFVCNTSYENYIDIRYDLHISNQRSLSSRFYESSYSLPNTAPGYGFCFGGSPTHESVTANIVDGLSQFFTTTFNSDGYTHWLFNPVVMSANATGLKHDEANQGLSICTSLAQIMEYHPELTVDNFSQKSTKFYYDFYDFTKTAKVIFSRITEKHWKSIGRKYSYLSDFQRPNYMGFVPCDYVIIHKDGFDFAVQTLKPPSIAKLPILPRWDMEKDLPPLQKLIKKTKVAIV